jgi:hypothetical protein
VPNAAKAVEVAVVGHDLGTMLDGERGEVGVSREVARRPGIA